MTGEYDQYR
ncbi:hypothetical protein YPPY03_2260, partial [Yersinia pestis PY-03]